MYNTTACAGMGGCEVDAPEELKQKYRDHLQAQAAEAVKIRVGKTVLVARGRKVKKGEIAKVLQMWEGQWGMLAFIELGNGNRVLTALKNLEVYHVA